jgi:hypothetical protein
MSQIVGRRLPPVENSPTPTSQRYIPVSNDEIDHHKNAAMAVAVYGGVSKILVDEADPNSVYVGEAAPGSAEADPKWRIKRIVISGTLTTITWAHDPVEGVGTAGRAQFVWNDRTVLNYI